MYVEHNSRLLFYREPFGALKCGDEVNIKLLVSDAGIPNAIRLACIWDGKDEEIKYNMAYEFSVGKGSLYKVNLKMSDNTGIIWYYFEIETNEGTFYYANNQRCMGGEGEMYNEKPSNLFQITVYEKDYKTPDWFKKSIVYQIFPDRFYNGNEDGKFLGNRNDIIKHRWNDKPFYCAEQFGGEYKCNDFYGGNLKGIEKKLPYLKELGISAVYLNPIFKAYSNHRYDTGSYDEIDEILGTEADFISLCKEADKNGIRIILDGVFNHTGSNSKYFNKNNEYDSVGAYNSESSPYYSWYRFFDWPNTYEAWWGIDTLPQVNEESKEYRDYILNNKDAIIKKWLRKGAYGWRLDVVDELPDFFVKELRKNVKSVNSDAVIIGEVWEDASNKIAYGMRREYFLGSELDSVMNYPMRAAIIDAILQKIDVSELDERLMSLKENYPAPAYYSLLNILSTHDVERIITLMSNALSRHSVSKEYQANYKINDGMLDNAIKRTILAITMQMTMPGVPCIYYGDEIGIEGYGDPFSRTTFPWDSFRKDDKASCITNAYKELIRLRNSSDAFISGEFESVYKYEGVYGYLRYTDNEKYLVLINMTDSDKRVRVDIARFMAKSIACLDKSGEILNSEDGIYIININALDTRIYKLND